MRRFANGFVIFCALACVHSLSADVSETHFVLQRAARIPGATLKSGRYTVRILDRLPDRYILEIVKDANPKSAITFLAIPDENLPHTADGGPTYWSNGAKTPVVRGMWLAGTTSAAEFVFPKAEAAALAKQVRQPVPAIDPDSEGKAAVAKMSEPDRQIVTLWLLSAVAVTPEGSKTEIQAAKFVPETNGQKAAADIAGTTGSTPSLSALPKESPKPAATLVAKADTRGNHPQTSVSDLRRKPAVAVPDQPTKMPKTAGTFAMNLVVGLLLSGAGAGVLYARKSQSA